MMFAGCYNVIAVQMRFATVFNGRLYVEREHKKTRAVAIGGVFLALSLATLFVATFIPGIELTMYAFSSFYVAFIIMESGIKGGVSFYIASLLLAAILVPNKGALLPYAMFFGLYGIVKYLIEKIKIIPVEMILKLIFFNISYMIGLLFFKELFLGNISLPDMALPILIVGAQAFFLFYDYLFTLIIGFYLSRRPKTW